MFDSPILRKFLETVVIINKKLDDYAAENTNLFVTCAVAAFSTSFFSWFLPGWAAWLLSLPFILLRLVDKIEAKE